MGPGSSRSPSRCPPSPAAGLRARGSHPAVGGGGSHPAEAHTQPGALTQPGAAPRPEPTVRCTERPAAGAAFPGPTAAGGGSLARGEGSSPAVCPGRPRAAPGGPWAGPGSRAPFSPSGPSAWPRTRAAGARAQPRPCAPLRARRPPPAPAAPLMPPPRVPQPLKPSFLCLPRDRCICFCHRASFQEAQQGKVWKS